MLRQDNLPDGDLDEGDARRFSRSKNYCAARQSNLVTQVMTRVCHLAHAGGASPINRALVRNVFGLVEGFRVRWSWCVRIMAPFSSGPQSYFVFVAAAVVWPRHVLPRRLAAPMTAGPREAGRGRPSFVCVSASCRLTPKNLPRGGACLPLFVK